LIWEATKDSTDVWVSEHTFEKSGVMWTFRTVKTAVFIEVQPNWIKIGTCPYPEILEQEYTLDVGRQSLR
jgi:hypothetical protein